MSRKQPFERHKRPIIGCTTYRKTVAQNPPIEVIGLMPSYIEAITAAGGVPILIPLSLAEEELDVILSQVDGLLLPGGGDIDPERYRETAAATLLRDIDADRDRVELALARTAVHQEKPLLAICRGHQVFNVALGGTLWQDIHNQIPSALFHDHYRAYPRNYLAHSVAVQPDSLLAHHLGKTTADVNSLHHQGIRDLASELQATATAPDGIIEGVEVPGHPFAIGVQWHPENLIHDDPAMLSLFQGLVKAAANGHAGT